MQYVYLYIYIYITSEWDDFDEDVYQLPISMLNATLIDKYRTMLRFGLGLCLKHSMHTQLLFQ